MKNNKTIKGAFRIAIYTMVVFLICANMAFAADHAPQNKGYKWASSPTVQYKIMAETYETQAVQAIDNMNSALTTASSSVKLLKGTKSTIVATSGNIVMSEGNWGKTGWVGLTSTSLKSTNSKQISSVQIHFNKWYFTKGNGYYNLNDVNIIQHVFAHELCHAIGIGHTPTCVKCKDCIVYPSIASFTEKGVYKIDSRTQLVINSTY